MERRKFLKDALLTSLALPLITTELKKVTTPKNGIRVGFSAINLAPCINDKQAYRYPLEAKCMAMLSDDQKVVLIALDFCELNYDVCWSLQTQISRQLNIHPESVLIHTTHTHSAPADDGLGDSVLDNQQLAALLIKVAEQAYTTAQPAKIKVAQQDVGKSLSVHRRNDTGTGLGLQTFWFGYEYAEGDDRPEASALINEMASRWQGEMGNYKTGEQKVYFDREVDPLVQTMQFVDMKNKPIGSIVRFSAHPHLASFFANRNFDPDFPGRARTLMEKTLGGHCIFLQGGSGNLVPKEKVKYKLDGSTFDQVYLGPISNLLPVDENQLHSEINRIGEAIAQAAITALNREKFTELTAFNYTFKPFNIPLDPTLPRSIEEIKKLREILKVEYQGFLNEKGKIDELRRFANVMNWLEWGAFYALGLTSETDRKNGYKPMPYSVLSVNATPVVFMNSEISVETTLALRKQFETKSPWVIGLTGGTLQYIPTDNMIDEGGYEGRNTVITRGTEQKIREHVAGMMG